MEQLTSKQQRKFVLYLVEACLQHGKETGQTFGEVLTNDVFADKASQDFEEMVCNNLKMLNQQGCISGTVELGYESELSERKQDESNIFIGLCTFDVTGITTKGKAEMVFNGLKEQANEFLDAVKPVAKYIASEALSLAVQTLIIHAVGI